MSELWRRWKFTFLTNEKRRLLKLSCPHFLGGSKRKKLVRPIRGKKKILHEQNLKLSNIYKTVNYVPFILKHIYVKAVQSGARIL